MRWLVVRVVTSSPANSMRPVRGFTIPRIVFSVVDLPDALPPSRHTSSPSFTSQVQVLEDVDLAVVGVDALELEQAHLVVAAFVPR